MMKPKTQGEELLDSKQAAARAGLDVTYFKGLARRGKGPKCLRPSPNVRLYTAEDVDSWVRGWEEWVDPSVSCSRDD